MAVIKLKNVPPVTLGTFLARKKMSVDEFISNHGVGSLSQFETLCDKLLISIDSNSRTFIDAYFAKMQEFQADPKFVERLHVDEFVPESFSELPNDIETQFPDSFSELPDDVMMQEHVNQFPGTILYDEATSLDELEKAGKHRKLKRKKVSEKNDE